MNRLRDPVAGSGCAQGHGSTQEDEACLHHVPISNIARQLCNFCSQRSTTVFG